MSDSEEPETNMVPEAPAEQIVISQEDAKRLAAWVEFFKKLSPRVKVVQPADEDFAKLYESLPAIIRQRKHLEDDIEILDFPEPELIAFIIACNSSAPDAMIASFDPKDAYFFCFDKAAFGVLYFEWDGDAEQGDGAKTYSLSNYSKEALEWECIKSLIVGRIKIFEDRVPELKD